MEPRNDKEAMGLLARWRATRDIDARDRLALYVYNKWIYRVETRRLFSGDPMQDRDDMKQVFFEGILRAIEKVDERGSPLFHLGQRGVWNVTSALRVTAIREHLVNQDLSETPPPAFKDTEPDFAEAVIRTLDAERVVARARVKLSGRAGEAFELITSGDVGDPMEPGFNQRLSRKLKVSEQRASQITAKLRKELEAV